MPYAVNETTKAHRVITQAKPLGEDESLLLTNKGGWIPWSGGECPLPKGTPSEYQMRNVVTTNVVTAIDDDAANIRWNDTGSDGDVIAYRPILQGEKCPGEGCSDQGCPHHYADEEPEPITGLKYDSEKPRYDLLLTGLPLSLEEVTQVLTIGAKKYADNNWRRVDHAETRYMATAMRHEVAHVQGENRDPETDRYHLAHKICCDLFRLELLMQEEV
jgi:hypothetical protein